MIGEPGCDCGLCNYCNGQVARETYADIPSMTLQRIRDEINDELGRRAEAALKRVTTGDSET